MEASTISTSLGNLNLQYRVTEWFTGHTSVGNGMLNRFSKKPVK